MKLKEEVMSKRFLLVLDGIRGEKEKRHNSKWENMLASPPCGSLGSKILVTIRMDSVTLMIAKNWRKLWRIPEKECFRIQGENMLFYRISEAIRHLAINSNNLEVVREIEKLKLVFASLNLWHRRARFQCTY
ncbi:hypothetical protein IEQ34_003484 [Dendrobium chrysotoxum]|uniref:Uncharacterized protein n=1 Tax=Dendrobium chrysotoxum TaxID=161865 RepID=A0AAV7HHE2_DENCH|nr:hypothetical protein IEQ34_003484 [Dendrobium chrysotoxum]